MNFPRPLTRIHQIELSSRCNLACVYCPHPKMQRPKMDMKLSTFARTLEWAKHFLSQPQGTQTELSLTGIGEALLHPAFIPMLGLARGALPDAVLLLATNGLAVTEELAGALRYYNCEVYVSLHRPEAASPAIKLLQDYGVKLGFNTSFATSALDWAGTVDWKVSAPQHECRYLKDGWGTVLADGRITTCCMDSEGLGVVGHVDEEIGSLGLSPYSLCTSCHLTVPA